MICALAGQRGHRGHHAGELRRRQHGQNGGAEQRGDLGARERRNQHAIGGRRGDIDQRRRAAGRKAALERHLEDEQRHQEHQREIDHGDRDVGKLLADQKFEAGDGGHVEVGDRAELLFANDGERHQDRRKQRQHQRHGRRHHRIDAVEILVVLEPDLDVGGRRRAAGTVVFTAGIRQIQLRACPADSRGWSRRGTASRRRPRRRPRRGARA